MSFDYVYIFLQSSLLETLVYWAFYRRRLSLGAIVTLVTASNALTHPVVFFGFLASSLSYLAAILLAEGFAVAAETGLHRWGAAGRLSWARAFAAAVVANLFSWQVAPALTYFFFLR